MADHTEFNGISQDLKSCSDNRGGLSCVTYSDFYVSARWWGLPL